MKKILFFFIFLLILGTESTIGQIYSGEEAREKVSGSQKLFYNPSVSSFPSYIALSGQEMIRPEDFKKWMFANFSFSPGNDLTEITSESDALGYLHQKYQQIYNGYPVRGAVFTAHIRNNIVESVSGVIFPGLSVSASPSVAEVNALNSALSYVKAKKYIWEDKAEESHLKEITGLPQATYYPKGALEVIQKSDGSFSLAWKFDVYAVQPLKRAFIFVDASTNQVIEEENRICHIIPEDHHCVHDHHAPAGDLEILKSNANAIGTAYTMYSGTQSITTDSYAGGYRLRMTGKGNGIETYNMNKGTNYGASTDFTDSDNIWNTTANYDNAAYDAHWGSEGTYDYYFNTFSRNSYNNSGAKLLSYIHYDVNYNNAFWDGSRMTYGDGSNSPGGFKPLTALDVVGHEFTHGVTQFSAGLVYSGESGALNESFSDIFGTAIEYFKKPASANFQIGEQIMFSGGALRNMANPKQYGQPNTYHGQNWDFVNMSVHKNSGVGNFYFYLLCQGGSGTNDKGDSYAVTGIGMQKAAAIAYRTLTVYLTPTSNYSNARFFSVQSAIDLYGACSQEVESVTNAWYAVGVGAVYSPTVTADFTASVTTFCSIPATVNFMNNSSNASSFQWNFGDGNTSTATNPAHTYTSFGTYSVTLTANGGACGSNELTKTNYIVVSSSASCPVNMPASGAGATQTACTGTLYDNGGTGNYSNNTNGRITISPSGASSVTLNFTSFDFETSWDYLYIYDGPTISSPLIGSYTGNSLPGGGTITSTGNSITLRQYTDGSITRPGFVCNWSCTMPTNPPTPAFTATPTVTCDGIISFTDQSTGGATSWNWNFGDGTTSTQQNPQKTYTTPGWYTVSLEACNTFGCSTLVKNDYINLMSSSACAVVNMPQTGTGPVQTSCDGKIYDSGGTGDYHNNTSGVITIAPTDASTVTLNFISFSFELNYDYLHIYDGPSTTSPLIGTYSGTNLPGGGIITSTGSSITLRQSTDGSVVRSGFEADWSCSIPTTPPVVQFSGSPLVTCDGQVNFTDLSTNGVTSWSWDFGDGTTSPMRNPVKYYTTAGTYTVSLTACNSAGCNTAEKQDYIISNIGNCVSVNMPSSGTGPTQTSCTGTLYDNGGTGNYSNNTNGVLTIAPTGASGITLTFNSFNFEQGYDYLHIYDGPSTSSPLIGSYSGTTLPGGGTIISTGGSITLRQSTDYSVTRPGFECNWNCTLPTDAPVVDFSANNTSTCNGIINFSDLSTNGPVSWDWDFGDGTYSTSQNPQKTYTTAGTYTVSLTACNSIGCNTTVKNDYISVNIGEPSCSVVNMPSTGTAPLQTSCNGTLYDNGGTGNYSNNTNGILTISPPGAMSVTLNFNSFNFESGYDYLHIYDGPSTSSPLIGSYTGTSLPGGGTVASTGGSITLRQFTDGSVTRPGFECTWNCVVSSGPPVADFSANVTSTCDGIIQFTDLSSNAPSSWSWDFGDGTSSTQRNPQKTYATPGTYTVSLIACNGFGCDTHVKENYIAANMGTPACSIVNLPASGTGPTQTSCSGTLYDNGGTGNYSNNTWGSITIAPPGATSVTLTFTAFNFQNGYDYLILYDGPSTASPMIGFYTGTTFPGGGIITSTVGSITIEQYTDETITAAGFVCEWSCNIPNSPPVIAFSVNATVTCNGMVQFTDQSSNGPASWNWDFGDGTSSTQQHPAKTYSTPGVYPVTLEACNGYGCNTLTKNNYVTYYSSTSCVNMPSTGTAPVQTSCTGVLYDNGGTSNYSNNTNGVLTIAPAGAATVTLSFSAFDFEAGWDYLHIYDGNSTSSPLIGSYTGNTLPNGGTITSTGSSITLRQQTDNIIDAPGFVCQWSCNILSDPPTAVFSANVTNTCGTTINFADFSSGNPGSWNWSFGDGTSSSLQHPVKTYSAAGTYTVSLTACNGIGCNTLTRQNYITINTGTPTCSGVNMPSTGNGPVQTSCSGVLYDDGGTGNYSNNTYSAITIAPAGATSVILNFTMFHFETGWDYLMVYDGPGTGSPLIGAYTGSSLPNGGTIISSGGSITIEQMTDNIITEAGFICYWSCSTSPVLSMPASGSLTQTSCEGTLYDDGGNGNYSNDTDGILTIFPENASSVILAFSSFDFEEDWDYLYIYDGPDIFSPLIGAYTGSTLPGGGIISSSGGSLTIRQVTDEIITAAGFYAQWWCVSTPIAAIPLPSGEEIFHIFPNPARDEVNIYYEVSGNKDLIVRIYDVLGQVIYQEQGNFSGNYSGKINLSGKAQGLYYVSIEDGEHNSIRKLFLY